MTTRTLGYALLAGAALLVVLMVAWFAVSGAHGGGIFLGLILLVVLSGPLAVAGIVVLASAGRSRGGSCVYEQTPRVGNGSIVPK